MSDLYGLLDALEQADSNNVAVVLATVVKVEGSAYRRPGARMLIPRDGQAVGTVSGGCLEQELVRKAWWLTESGLPVIRRYSTAAHDEDDSDEEGAALTFGLGCNGTVHVLLERLEAGAPSLLTDVLQGVRATGEPAALATVLAAGAGSGARMGARLGLTALSRSSQGFCCDVLESRVQADLLATLERKKSSRMIYASGAQAVEVLLEYIPAQRRLVVFGAGNDAQPLVRFAVQLNWQVHVVDGRANFARAERFAGAREVLVASIDQPFALRTLVDGAAVVIMTHSYRQDRFWLQSVLACAPAYIGQLGPKERTERLLDEMGGGATAARAELHYPMGLDLGGDTPQSVALAIVSEITACLNQREGGMLRLRKARIHDPADAQHAALSVRSPEARDARRQ